MEIPFCAVRDTSLVLKKCLGRPQQCKVERLYGKNESRQKCQKGGYDTWQSLKLLVHEVRAPLWFPRSRFAAHKGAVGVAPTHVTTVLLTWKGINSFK